MATTTNYGWTTPDDTALVKDGASAIRSLGTAIDTTTKNLNPQTTTGAIAYRSSTSNVNTSLPLGTAGQVLTVNSGATAPEWASPSGGMTLISTTTLTGASVTLSSIPQTYLHLYVVVRNFLPATDAVNFSMRFNADSTANRHQVYGINELGYGNTSTFGQSVIQIGGTNDNSVGSGLMIMNVYDYTNTVTWKFARSEFLFVDSTTTTSARIGGISGFYNQTSAITSLQFLPGSGNFTSGTVLLYGVK